MAKGQWLPRPPGEAPVHPAVAWPTTGAFRVAGSDQALLRHPGRIA